MRIPLISSSKTSFGVLNHIDKEKNNKCIYLNANSNVRSAYREIASYLNDLKQDVYLEVKRSRTPYRQGIALYAYGSPNRENLLSVRLFQDNSDKSDCKIVEADFKTDIESSLNELA